eukprot:Gregarina_sp_Poly_1__4879@NODE_2598_length_1934_cov_62_171398_g1609_i1_p2_GENE_NODE_2598_length_1934_cov_62_171398_g1609_i1NODE_2598_length_1934_cov_62_171398_g1609_i1_p2_ORF_typecomplete_len126_score13_68Adaptin_N/PF01602_20/1_9e08_NODE_2598_length_1934_cov_62_171398_g1609_i114761853
MDLRCASFLSSNDADIRGKGIEGVLKLELEGADLENSLPLLLKLSASEDFMTKCVSHKFLRTLKYYHREDLSVLVVNTLEKDRLNPDPSLRFLALRATLCCFEFLKTNVDLPGLVRSVRINGFTQ